MSPLNGPPACEGERRSCPDVRARIVDAVLGSPRSPGRSQGETLGRKVREHIERCDECRAFLDDLLAINEMACLDREQAEGLCREAVESGVAFPAVQAAIEEGLERRASLAGRKGTSLAERLAFLVFASSVLFARALLLSRLRPGVVLGVEAGMNWLAPFVFYVMFRLERRAASRAGPPQAEAFGATPGNGKEVLR